MKGPIFNSRTINWRWGLLVAGLTCMLGSCVPKAPTSPASVSDVKGWRASVERVENGFGYVLLQDGAIRIRQLHIPAVGGLQPFPDSMSAVRVSGLAIEKINSGLFPPTLTEEEVIQAIGATVN